MKHLVTGGSGFLGNLIARRLLAQGHEVRILDVWEDANRPREIEVISADIRDRDKVAAAMRGVEVVHHNVALVPLTKANKLFWDVNVEGSRLAAQEAVQAGVKSFIHMSSSAIFGAPPCPITADTPTRPIEIYGRAKLAGEQAVREECQKGNLPLIVIRPRTILGEGRLGIFQILFKWIADGRNVYVIGSGNGLFQFVHALDLMDAYMLILAQARSGDFNVGAAEFGTLRQALENLIAFAGTKSKVKSLPQWLTINSLRVLDWVGLSPLAPWHYLTYHKPFYFDVSPLLALGWKPAYSNDRMLRESYEWFMSHRTAQDQTTAASPHRKAVKEKVLGLLRRIS